MAGFELTPLALNSRVVLHPMFKSVQLKCFITIDKIGH